MENNILLVDRMVKRIIERADSTGIEAGRKLYMQMSNNPSLTDCMDDVDASLLLAGRDELIVDIKEC